MKIRESGNGCHFILLAFTLVLFVTGLCMQSEAQLVGPSAKPSPPPGEFEEVIRVDTDLVTVPVTVMDRNGRYVTDLTKDSFELFDDHVEQDISLFEPVESPFTIILLLDVSSSLYKYRADLVSAANLFVKKLRPDDQLMVVIYWDWIKVLLPPTKIRELKKGLSLRRPRGVREEATVTFDAVDMAFKQMKRVSGRKAIVMFTDGEFGGLATAKKNLRDAEEQDALIYPILFADLSDVAFWGLREFRKNEAYIEGLAAKSGGRSYKFENISKLESVFEKIVDELGRQYSLGYYPKNKPKAGERREIKVRVKQPGMAVRARESYVVGKTKK